MLKDTHESVDTDFEVLHKSMRESRTAMNARKTKKRAIYKPSQLRRERKHPEQLGKGMDSSSKPTDVKRCRKDENVFKQKRRQVNKEREEARVAKFQKKQECALASRAAGQDVDEDEEVEQAEEAEEVMEVEEEDDADEFDVNVTCCLQCDSCDVSEAGCTTCVDCLFSI